MASAAIRSIKNVTKGYSAVQVKVRNATSNDPWGPTGAEMAEIASMTFNGPQDFVEIVDMLEKRLNDKGKNWRHVLKSLKVVDYCIHEGTEMFVTWARKNLPVIKTLESFENVDEDGKDVGMAIRSSAKELSSLIRDDERLRSERGGGKWQSRVQGGAGDLYSGYGNQSSPVRPRQPRKRRDSENDAEYKLALEASKAEAEAEARRRANGEAEEDDDIAQAIKLSKEEDELRRRELERQNAEALFDDSPAVSQPTGYNQGYQQQIAVDWYGNPMDQQQPQTTGYLNNMYTQPLQPQYTAYQQPQQTGMPQYMPAQPTGHNPWTNSMNGMQQPQQQQQQQQAPVQQPQPTGSNNPWAANNQQQAMAPMPTGSNNPFASKMANSSVSNTQRHPTLSSLQEQRTAQYQPSSNPIMNYQAPQQAVPASAPAQSPAKNSNPVSPHHAQLNALLASGAGLDTYGNTGDLRLPAQHTAPGTYVNSTGQGLNQLEVHRTGTNPFLHNQFTGTASGPYPAQTGPVNGMQGNGLYGYQGQQQGGAQGGSLIDL